MPTLRELVLACTDRHIAPVSIPEWGIEAFMRSWSGVERSKLTAAWVALKDKPAKKAETDALTLVLSLCNADGEPIFTDKDIPLLTEKRGDVLARLSDAALAHNGIGVEQAIEKN